MTGLPVLGASTAGSRPGDALLHPAAVSALILLLLNDHALKGAFPGWWTGKLSDAAGVVVLAVVLLSLAELLGMPIARRTLVGALLLSGMTLVAIKIVPVAGDLFRWGLGGVQWVGGTIAAASLGRPTPSFEPVQLVQDPSDLFVLPTLLVGWIVLRHRRPT